MRARQFQSLFRVCSQKKLDISSHSCKHFSQNLPDSLRSCRLPGNSDETGAPLRLPEKGFRGLAVAPCCHHRCSWQHYVGRDLFTRLGLSALEFEIISWMTGVLHTQQAYDTFGRHHGPRYRQMPAWIATAVKEQSTVCAYPSQF